MSYSAKSIANGLLHIAQERGLAISNMKMQKLLYFANGFWCAYMNESLISEAAEAWQYGPVYPSVYHAFKLCGSGAIDRPATVLSAETGLIIPAALPNAHVMDYLGKVMNSYGAQSAVQLSALSHVPGGPWARVRHEEGNAFNSEIPEAYIRDYFKAAISSQQAAAAAG